MEKVSFPAPSLYGDHHVLEVRQVLLALPGVLEVHASSCFQVIEVSYNPDQVSPQAIAARLDASGYLEDLPSPVETIPNPPRRRTAMYEQTSTSVGFKQELPAQPRSAWPCPGMGLLKGKEG